MRPMIIALMIFMLTICIATQQAAALEIYISPDGSDANNGTISAPLRTLKRAQEYVRNKLPQAKGPVTVMIRGGKYYLDDTVVFGPDDSGTASVPVIYSNYNDEQVIISGGFAVSTQWNSYSDNIIMTNIGAGRKTDLLFLDGVQQIMCRYPNFDASKVYLDGFAPDAISPERASRWSDPSTGYIRALHNAMWGGNDYRITGKDSDNSVQFSWIGDNNRGGGMHSHYRMVENIFEELDAPGEWFYNSKTGDLYFYPPEGIDIANCTVEMANAEELVRIVGSETQKVEYITLSGLNFTHVKRTIFSGKYEGLLRGDWAVVRAGAVFINNAENITIKNCVFDQVGGNAIFISGFNRDHLIDNNVFIDAGASCIQIVGLPSACRYPSTWSMHHDDIIDTTPGPLNENYPRDIVISNNYMFNMGRFEKQSAGVNISMSESVTVRNNTIHRSPRSGVNINDGTFGGHVIEYNDIFDCVRESGDHGPFNSWGRDRFWSFKGFDTNGNRGEDKYPYRNLDAWKPTVIRNNRFHYQTVQEWGVDLDDGSSNYQIYNNLCLNTGFKLREGFDRHVYNNIIINERANIHCTYQNAKNNVEKNIIVNAKPIDFANSDTDRELRAHSNYDYNTYWNNGKAIEYPAKWLESGFDSHSIVADPIFRDPASNDYTVTNSEVLEKTGFVNFPMNRFGKAGSPEPEPISYHGITATREIGKLMGATITSVRAAEQSVAGLPDTNGIFFQEVPDKSIAYSKGFRDNDVIRTVNGKTVLKMSDFRLLYNTISENSTVEVMIYRNQSLYELSYIKDPD